MQIGLEQKIFEIEGKRPRETEIRSQTVMRFASTAQQSHFRDIGGLLRNQFLEAPFTMSHKPKIEPQNELFKITTNNIFSSNLLYSLHNHL